MNDKFKHIAAGLLVALVVGLPAYLDSGNLFAGIWPAISGGCIAGAIKEWCDNKYEWVWSWKDLGWTCLGVLIAVALIILLHIAKG